MRPRREQGYIALSLLLIVVVGVSTFALSSFNNATRPPAEVVKRQQIVEALESAKAELLAYAGNTHVIHGDRGPGYFPLPLEATTMDTQLQGGLPHDIREGGKTLYRINTPDNRSKQQLRYQVASDLVYGAGNTQAARRTETKARLRLDTATHIAALLIHSGSDYDDVVLAITHEEFMNTIAPVVGLSIGQALNNYYADRRRYPRQATQLILPTWAGGFAGGVYPDDEDEDEDDHKPTGSGPAGPSHYNGTAAPPWIREENWLTNLVYERQRRGLATFSLSGCPGISFTVDRGKPPVRIGNRCGN